MLKAVTLYSLLLLATSKNAFTFDLKVLHVNDFHARFEETNDAGSTCKDDQCIGGFSRLYHVIKEAVDQDPNTVVLNGGDSFQGTLWYNMFKWNVTQYFMNLVPFEAHVLGNHEFDHGIAGVVPYIQHLNAPVVVSNIDDSEEPTIQGTYKKSTVIERDGKKIGIVGVILKTTDEISSTEKLKFLDESESVNAEAERLVKEENVFTNIVLSHCGYDVEKEIARKATAASKISLVVGAHSHTFLYTGEPIPGPGNPYGPYPTIVPRDDDGKDVLVVQASAYCRYLGNITVSYDDNGDYTAWAGAPIFLATDVPQDETINQLMQPWKEGIEELGNRVLGSTLVTLDQTTCRYSECLLGNFVADAMVHAYTKQAENNSWTYAALAVTNVGGLRTTIEKGDITYNDMVTAQPFENTLDVGELQGKYIKEMFEFSMTSYYTARAVSLNLLQISGFQIVADLDQPVGSRIQSIKVRCQDCSLPIYEDLDEDKSYRLITNSFLRGKGDGFSVIGDNMENVIVGIVDIDVFVDYLETKSPTFEEVIERMEFVGETQPVYRQLSWD